MFDGLETRDIVVFGLGFTTACFVIWLLMVVGGWLKQIVKSGQRDEPGGGEKPGAGEGPAKDDRTFEQRLRAALRNLAAVMVILLVLALLLSFAYSAWFQTNP